MLNSSAYTAISCGGPRWPDSTGSRCAIFSFGLLGRRLRLGLVDENGDRDHPIALAGLHDGHASGRSPVAVHGAHLGAQDRSFLGDHHHLLVLAPDDAHGGDVSGLVVERVGDHASRGAVLDGELVEYGSLAVALLGDDQQLRPWTHNLHPDHLVPLAQPDPGHAPRVASHGPYLRLVEASRLSLPGGQDHVGLSIGPAYPS